MKTYCLFPPDILCKAFCSFEDGQIVSVSDGSCLTLADGDTYVESSCPFLSRNNVISLDRHFSVPLVAAWACKHAV